jgi:hypothetical protein
MVPSEDKTYQHKIKLRKYLSVKAEDIGPDSFSIGLVS